MGCHRIVQHTESGLKSSIDTTKTLVTSNYIRVVSSVDPRSLWRQLCTSPGAQSSLQPGHCRPHILIQHFSDLKVMIDRASRHLLRGEFFQKTLQRQLRLLSPAHLIQPVNRFNPVFLVTHSESLLGCFSVVRSAIREVETCCHCCNRPGPKLKVNRERYDKPGYYFWGDNEIRYSVKAWDCGLDG